MCKCRYTTREVLQVVNEKRTEAGMNTLPYQNFLIFYRGIKNFMPPDEVVGNNYIFRKGKVARIVKALWNKPYRAHFVDWFAWKNAA